MNGRRAIFENYSPPAPHAGLWLDAYLTDLESEGRVSATLGTLLLRPPNLQGYRLAYRRFAAGLESQVKRQRAASGRFEVRGRLVVNKGRASVWENSLALDWTWGVPYLPGSALKGLSRRLAKARGWSTSPGSDISPFDVAFGCQKSAGYVRFLDALWDPGNATSLPLQLDVTTNHHKQYYENGDAPPADWDEPEPHRFVTVGGTFLVGITGPDNSKGWCESVLELLEEGLTGEGLGAMTNSGYGRLRKLS